MIAALAIGMISIAAILFYKLVDREHKLMVAKLALAIVVLGVFYGFAVEFYDYKTDKRANQKAWDEAMAELEMLSGADVKFVGDSTTTVSSPDTYCKLYTSDPHAKCPDRVSEITTVTFRICNRSQGKTITRVRFVPKTAARGHSSSYDLEKKSDGPMHLRNTLESDRILSPRECADEGWSGYYYLKDSTFADVVDVQYRADPLLPPSLTAH
jgi:hypothetical protein